MRTSELECVRREMADEFMALNPGVTRQQAKRIVSRRAAMRVQGRQIHRAMQQAGESFQKFARAWSAHR